MPQKIVVDPVTRIEGHLKIEVEVEGGKVVDARTSGTLFRGLELIMRGRDPRDAQQFMQRICGVCPTGHATAGTLALDDAFGIAPPKNGRIIRNLILGSNYIQSHVLHFFHLAALDYVNAAAVVNAPPFTPQYQFEFKLPSDVNKAAVEAYIQALVIRRKAQEMLAIWGGKMPHVQAIVPGGVTEHPDAQKIAEFKSRLKELIDFVDNTYIPIVEAVAKYYPEWLEIGAGCKNMLAYGGFPLEDGKDHISAKKLFPGGIVFADGSKAVFDPNLVSEQVKYSWYKDEIAGKPTEAVVEPDPQKAGAYSWLKAPRYDGKVMEVGPLARMIVMEEPRVKALGAKAYSVLGRHYARAIECSIVAHAMDEWVTQLEIGQPVCTPHEVPSETRQGVGLCEAARGALGHWHRIENGLTRVYNAVVPTTWNASPRDEKGQRGAMEEALVGTPVKDPKNPVELVRVVRSFDPCFGCAIHLMTPDKKTIAEFQIG